MASSAFDASYTPTYRRRLRLVTQIVNFARGSTPVEFKNVILHTPEPVPRHAPQNHNRKTESDRHPVDTLATSLWTRAHHSIRRRLIAPSKSILPR